MYLHVVDGPSQTIASIPDVLKVIDEKYDFLKDYYAGFAIENVVVNMNIRYKQQKRKNTHRIHIHRIAWAF